jgi:hypothetical protein
MTFSNDMLTFLRQQKTQLVLEATAQRDAFVAAMLKIAQNSVTDYNIQNRMVTSAAAAIAEIDEFIAALNGAQAQDETQPTTVGDDVI